MKKGRPYFFRYIENGMIKKKVDIFESKKGDVYKFKSIQLTESKIDYIKK